MDIFGNIVSWLTDQLNNVLSWVTYLLPPSPFQLLDMTPLHDILPYINYFVPVEFMVNTLALWGSAILGYYAYHVILRWIKAVE